MSVGRARKAAGLCLFCDTPPLPSRSMCELHAARNRANAKKQRLRALAKARKLDVCRTCFTDLPKPESTLCVTCTKIAADKAATRRDRYRELGLCSICGRKRASESKRCKRCGLRDAATRNKKETPCTSP